MKVQNFALTARKYIMVPKKPKKNQKSTESTKKPKTADITGETSKVHFSSDMHLTKKSLVQKFFKFWSELQLFVFKSNENVEKLSRGILGKTWLYYIVRNNYILRNFLNFITQYLKNYWSVGNPLWIFVALTLQLFYLTRLLNGEK